MALICLGLAVSCAGKSEQGGSGVSGSAANGNGSQTDSSGVSLNVGTTAAGTNDGPKLPDGEACGTSCPAGQSTCAAETCDGVDNNCDGIIDNIDKNADGICDCILIATLGVKGTSGQGDVFSTWLAARSNNGATALGDQVLTPALLSKYEVIVAENVSRNHPYAPAEVQALKDWVTKGGGFMTLIGYSNRGEEANVNTLLQPFGANYGDMQILRKTGGTTVPITQWAPHPVDTGVTAVGVDNGLEVQGTGTMFARGGGFNVGEGVEVGKGHVLLWGDEWITYDSEWTAHPDYQVQLFWLNAIKWLTVAGTCQIPIPPSLGGLK
jgi:hypothetical protein